MNDPTKVKIVPISSFIAVSIITIFSLYLTNVIKTIPCGDTVLSSFYSNFLHIEPAHLIGNLTALYALSRVERAIGSKQFIALIIFLLVFNSIVESIIHKRYPNIPCSIGFSGVLFGIMSWEMITNNKFDAVTFPVKYHVEEHTNGLFTDTCVSSKPTGGIIKIYYLSP